MGGELVILLIVAVFALIYFTTSQAIATPQKGVLPTNERVDNINVVIAKQKEPVQPVKPPVKPSKELAKMSKVEVPETNRFLLHTLDEITRIEEAHAKADAAEQHYIRLIRTIRLVAESNKTPKTLVGPLELFHNWEQLRRGDTARHSKFLWLARQESDISNMWAKHMTVHPSACTGVENLVHTLESHLITRYVTMTTKEYNESQIELEDTLVIFFQLVAVLVVHDSRCCNLSARLAASVIESEKVRNAFAAIQALLFCSLQYVTKYPNILTVLAILGRKHLDTLVFLYTLLAKTRNNMDKNSLTTLKVGIEIASRVFPLPSPLFVDLTRPKESMIYIEIPEELMEAFQKPTSKQPRKQMVRNIWFTKRITEHKVILLYFNHLFRPIPHFCEYTNMWGKLGVLSIFESINDTTLNQESTDVQNLGNGYDHKKLNQFEMSSQKVRICNDAKLNSIEGIMTQQLFEKVLTNEGNSQVSMVNFLTKEKSHEKPLIIVRGDLSTSTINPADYTMNHKKGGLVHHVFNLHQLHGLRGAQDFSKLEVRYLIHSREKGMKSIKTLNVKQIAQTPGKTEYAANGLASIKFELPVRRNRLIVQSYLHNRNTDEKVYFEITTAANDGKVSTMPESSLNVKPTIYVNDKGGVTLRITHLRTLTKVHSSFIFSSENSDRSFITMEALRRFKYYLRDGYINYADDNALEESCKLLNTSYIRQL